MKESTDLTLDHVVKSLHDCNYIKYVAYRTSSKIRILQKSFYLEKLSIAVLGGVLNRHHLTRSENSLCLTSSELHNILEDVYFIVSREHVPSIDIDKCATFLSRFIFKVLQKETGVELLGVKILLCVLCGSKPKDKYNYLFSQLSNHNSVLTSRRLELMLQRLVLLTEFIGEGSSFGRPLIPGTVRSCFDNLPTGSVGVSLDVFMAWLTRDPQLLVWLSTLHRLHLADTVVHDVKCSVCKVYPMPGLRYRCLRCLSYNQCQHCFFSGSVSRTHKMNHPVQEYCYQSTAKQSLKALLVTLRNKFCRSVWTLQYLPAEQRDSYLEETTLQLDQLEESMKALTQTSAFSLNELENIIMELADQSRKLQESIQDLKSPLMRNMLENHRTLVEKQVERLKKLKMQLAQQKGNCGMINSTPCAQWTRRNGALDAISPIVANSLALTWDKYDIGEVEEEGPCVVTWEEGNCSSSSDADRSVSSHAYTWLQCTESNSKALPSGSSSANDRQVDRPEDIQALHDDLDEILNRLQELLAHKSNSGDVQELPPNVPESGLGNVLDLL